MATPAYLAYAQRRAFWDAGNGKFILETLLTDGKTQPGQGMVTDHDPHHQPGPPDPEPERECQSAVGIS